MLGLTSTQIGASWPGRPASVPAIDGLAACTGGGLAACTSSTCNRNCLMSSCRFSLMKSWGKCNEDRLIALRGRVDMANSSAQERASTRSCFESLLVVPYLPQVIWETSWRRAVYPMLPDQLFQPRVPNRGDVPRT